MTLTDMIQMSNVPLIQNVIYNLGMHSPLLSTMDFVLGKEIRKDIARYDGVNAPTPAWVKIGDPVGEFNGKFERASASMYHLRGKITLDKVEIENPQAIGDPVNTQIKMYLNALSRTFNSTLINNDNISGNVDAFDGFRGRMNKRTDYLIPAELRVDSALDLRPTAVTAASAATIFRQLDEMIEIVTNSGDFGSCMLFMNDKVKAALNQAARVAGTGGGFTTTMDAQDRQVETFRGLRIINPGLNYPLRSMSRIMTNTETAAGTLSVGGTFSSIFVARFAEDGIVPWMRHSMDEAIVHIPKEANDGYNDVIALDIGLSMINTSSTALGQLFNLRVS